MDLASFFSSLASSLCSYYHSLPLPRFLVSRAGPGPAADGNMTKLILSTGNIVSGGPSIIRKPGAYRSNLELTNSLRSNFLAARQAVAAEDEGDISDPEAVAATAAAAASGDIDGSRRRPPLAAWTQRDGDTLYIPRVLWPGDEAAGSDDTGSNSSGALQEEASEYETTVKLFFLPGAEAKAEGAATPEAIAAARARYADEALALVFRALGVGSVDLLVLSFPGMAFEGDCEWEADKRNAAQGDDAAEQATWRAVAERLHAQKQARRLGVAEFGSDKLRRFLDGGAVTVPPAVDQINIRDCCSVPPPLRDLAKERGIDLLVHTDCTNILPPGTLRELLGPGLQGAGVLAAGPEDATTAPAPAGGALKGDLTPQWVVKYTAVVRDRGVIENKGYFAGALLHDST